MSVDYFRDDVSRDSFVCKSRGLIVSEDFSCSGPVIFIRRGECIVLNHVSGLDTICDFVFRPLFEFVFGFILTSGVVASSIIVRFPFDRKQVRL